MAVTLSCLRSLPGKRWCLRRQACLFNHFRIAHLLAPYSLCKTVLWAETFTGGLRFAQPSTLTLRRESHGLRATALEADAFQADEQYMSVALEEARQVNARSIPLTCLRLLRILERPWTAKMRQVLLWYIQGACLSAEARKRVAGFFSQALLCFSAVPWSVSKGPVWLLDVPLLQTCKACWPICPQTGSSA